MTAGRSPTTPRRLRRGRRGQPHRRSFGLLSSLSLKCCCEAVVRCQHHDHAGRLRRLRRTVGSSVDDQGRPCRRYEVPAIEYATRGIRVNAISPGVIQTPMYPAGELRRFRPAPSDRTHRQVSDNRRRRALPRVRVVRHGRDLHVDGGPDRRPPIRRAQLARRRPWSGLMVWLVFAAYSARWFEVGGGVVSRTRAECEVLDGMLAAARNQRQCHVGDPRRGRAGQKPRYSITQSDRRPISNLCERPAWSRSPSCVCRPASAVRAESRPP